MLWSLVGDLREVLVLDATVQWVVTATCGTQEEEGEGAMELGAHEGQTWWDTGGGRGIRGNLGGGLG